LRIDFSRCETPQVEENSSFTSSAEAGSFFEHVTAGLKGLLHPLGLRKICNWFKRKGGSGGGNGTSSAGKSMRITVTYEVSGNSGPVESSELQQMLLGPLKTGADQANYQLAAEGKTVRLKLISSQIEEGKSSV
jgi:hypothetical protein